MVRGCLGREQVRRRNETQRCQERMGTSVMTRMIKYQGGVGMRPLRSNERKKKRNGLWRRINAGVIARNACIVTGGMREGYI